MANGTTYVIKPLSPLARQGAPGSGERIKSVLGGMIRGMGDAITAPGRALQGDPVNNADVATLAGMVQLGGAAMPAPKGALRSGALLDEAAETTAQKVARLLRDGRAADVTDDMMAAVDPQEMHGLYTSGATGADMPMDAASRDARAWGMGFRDDAYHGTNAAADFQSFGQSRGSRRAETYIAPEKHRDYANSYAASDQGRVMPLKVKTTGFHDGRTSAGRDALLDLAYEKNFQPELMYGHMRGDPETRRLVAWGDQRTIDELSDAGYPGAFIEERPWMDSAAVFDKSRLRSRFARFDPRLGHLANLNAANASPAAGLLGMEAAQDDDLAGIRAYLESMKR